MKWLILLLLIACGGAEIETKNLAKIDVASPSFRHNEMIPAKFTCQGDDINPALTIDNLPEGTKSLALIMDDPDAPVGVWDHWIMWNIVPGNIEENSVPGVQGKNSWGRNDYGGPCPPSGTHRYYFKVFALDTELSINEGTDKAGLNAAMKGHILGYGELIGKYQKP